MNGNLLVVGTSFAETAEVGNLALANLAWAGGLVQKRMQAITATMARVGHGEVSARVPVRKSGDDVNALSRQINSALDRLVAWVEGMRQVRVDIAHDLAFHTPLYDTHFRHRR